MGPLRDGDGAELPPDKVNEFVRASVSDENFLFFFGGGAAGGRVARFFFVQNTKTGKID
jgi:hypothetical protein